MLAEGVDGWFESGFECGSELRVSFSAGGMEAGVSKW